MSIDWLFDLIFADPPIPLDEIAQAIETRLTSDQITADVLERVRLDLRNGNQDEVLRAMLVGARSAPAAVAASLAVYGMWLARKNLRQISPDLLRVAAWAYHWAGDQVGRGRALVNLAAALFVRDDFDQAEVDARTALEIFEREEDALGVVKSHLIIGSIAYECQQPERMLSLGAALLEMLKEGDIVDQAQRVDTLLLLGVTAEDLQDNFTHAQSYYCQAEGRLAQVANQTAYAFRLHLNLGYLQMRLGRHGDARHALAMAEQVLAQGRASAALASPDDYDLRLAQLQHAMQVDDRARARIYLQELTRLQGTGEDSPKQRAEISLFTGLLKLDPDQALLRLESAAEAFLAPALHMELLGVAALTYLAERAYQAGNAKIGKGATARARALLEGYHVPRRRLELERIAALYDQGLSLEQREQVADALDQEGDYLGGAAVWNSIGIAHERARSLPAAAAAYERAMRGVEQSRGMVRLSLQPTEPLDLRCQAYGRALALSQAPAHAFQISERARAQSLLDELSNAGIWRLLDHADLAEIRNAYERLLYERAQISLRTPRSHQAELHDEPEPQAGDLHVAERAYFAVLEDIQARRIPQAGWVTGAALSHEEICRALPPASLLVAYTLVPQGARDELWLTTLRSDGDLRSWRALNGAQWQGFLQRWPAEGLLVGKSAAGKEQQIELLRELHIACVEPIRAQIGQIRNLIVALDERMPLLPIHAAYDEGFLIERVAVSYVPSGSALSLIRARQAGRSPRPELIIAGWDAAGTGMTTLADVPADLAQLAGQLGGSAWHGPMLLDALLARIVQARVLHLSCHGIFPLGSSPRFAHLVIGPQPLYADDLYRADLAADLVFFNACDSGQHGVGLQGLVGAALVSGASAVIAAMWKVKPAIGQQIARRFYAAWQAGSSCGEALRAAQVALLKQHNPVDWSPFYLTGLPDLDWLSAAASPSCK